MALFCHHSCSTRQRVAMGIMGGSVIGLISGYFEGVADLTIQRLMDALISLPTLVLSLSAADQRELTLYTTP